MRRARRQIRRSDHSVHSCLHSVAHDQKFVERALESLGFSLGTSEDGGEGARGAVFVNLRCGLWYAPPRAPPSSYRRCYFKSTDGHTNNCDFSYIRLNAHLALTAASRGGVAVLDATRRGKRFPDSMLKTLPIWCCVVNRAVRMYRFRSADAVGCDCEWDVQLHLNPLVPENERSAIETRLDAWAEGMLQSGADMRSLSISLQRPLRPIWISTATRLWTAPEGAAGDIGQGRIISCPPSLMRMAGDGALPFYPVVCLSVSETEMCRKTTHGGGSSYTYVPGAGDDEETWALGLTPDAFWEHRSELLEATQADVDTIACRIAASHHIAGSTRNAMSWIGDTRIAIGDASAGRPPDVWSHVDAIVNLGQLEHPGMVSSPPAHCGEDPSPSGKNYLRVAMDTKSKHSLELQMESILAFAHLHLSRGRRLLFQCDTGEDRSVCACLAVLVELFEWDSALLTLGLLRPLRCCENAGVGGEPRPLASKEEVRRRLAFLSSHCPNARPSRMFLKQVYNYCSRFTHEWLMPKASATVSA